MCKPSYTITTIILGHSVVRGVGMGVKTMADHRLISNTEVCREIKITEQTWELLIVLFANVI
jgi:hypothetical protein